MTMEKHSLSRMAFPNEKATRKHSEKFKNLNKIRTKFPFQLDKERITRCKAFRRLKHKTQFFLTPRNDVYRTRITHTIETAEIARAIAQTLELNTDLAECIALAHDLGHAPFGHAGERALDKAVRKLSRGKMGFDHNIQSFKIATKLEQLGEKEFGGLNLTQQVLEGILFHKRGHANKKTEEAVVAMLADDITYVNHDFEDLVDSGFLIKTPTSFLSELKKLGNSHEERINVFIEDVYTTSCQKKHVAMGVSIRRRIARLRKLLHKEVLSQDPFREKETEAERYILMLYEFFTNKNNGKRFKQLEELGYLKDQTVIDLVRGDTLEVALNYVAGMTDTFATDLYKILFAPEIQDYKF